MEHKVDSPDVETISQFVNKNIKELQTKAKHEKRAYFLLATILLLINLATVVVAIVALVIFLEHVVISERNGLAVAGAITSVAIVLTIFVLQNINVIYRGLNKDKFFKKAIDKIQHEYMQHSFSREEYSGDDKDAVLERQVKHIFNKYTNKKRKKGAFIIFRALLGGKDA